jgi:ABC-2 type transport system permease protein
MSALEGQRAGWWPFLRAAAWAGWLQYRDLRYYPSNLVLAAIQQFTLVGVWYFTARFFGTAGNDAVRSYGGNYVAYVLLGVMLNQVGTAALNQPFQTVSNAFWDKRLETYRLAGLGIWANMVGRLAYTTLFATFMQGVVFAVLVATGALPLHAGAPVGVVVLAFALMVAANAGLGLLGSSFFFLLEVKSGQDPVTWLYRYVVMIVSGLYIPVALLPGWLRALGAVLPQTYAFAVVRAALLTGAGAGSPVVGDGLAGLAVGALATCLGGYALFAHALSWAERHSGIGVVV